MAGRMKLEIAYDGRSFHGWQQQREHRTVQGELQGSLAALFRGHRVSVVGAGRTDAGVHSGARPDGRDQDDPAGAGGGRRLRPALPELHEPLRAEMLLDSGGSVFYPKDIRLVPLALP